MDPEVTVTSEMSLGREGPAGDSPSLSARTGGLASFLNSIRFAFGPRAAALMGASMLGLAVPLAAGQMTGHPAEGMAASLGGLALGGAASGGTFGDRAKTLVYDLIAGCLGMLIGSSLARYGIVAVGLPAAAALAGLFGGISRPLVRASILFLVYMVIATSIETSARQSIGLMVLFGLGAAWCAGLALVLEGLFQRIWGRRDKVEARPRYTWKQLLRRWRYSLKRLAGWQYVLRITLCLLAAQGFELVWPGHRGYWVSLTVVIVVQRFMSGALTRTRQRAAGTFVGVFLISLFLLAQPSPWLILCFIAVLGAARPVLQEVNYVAYAAVMTPLVILLLEFGREPSLTVAVDRLIATLVGCAIALTFGYIGWSRLAPAGPQGAGAVDFRAPG